MKKHIFLLKIIASFLLIFSFNKAIAFLDSDLGLNLYKDIENGMDSFEEKQIEYELSGQDRGKIGENINQILKSNQILDCLKPNTNIQVINKISNGELESLSNLIIESCKDKNKSISTKKVAQIISQIQDILEKYKKKVRKKTHHIEEISRLGMYVDGNSYNSPFDLIVDLQEIDKIIFKQEIDYNSDNNIVSELEDYKNNPFKAKDNNNYDEKLDSGNNNSNNNFNGNNLLNSGIIGSGNINSNNNLDSSNLGNIYSYNCITNNNSGLSTGSLNELINGDKNYGKSYTYVGGHIKLPSTNKINFPNLSNSGFYDKLNKLNQKDAGIWSAYKHVNDNSIWKCNKFFCIIIDFVVNNFNPIDFNGSRESKTIENILETTAKIFKRTANTSLVQHKMTTNNFEMSLRDLNLPDIFHMGVVVSSMPMPILDLEKEDKEEKKDTIENSKKIVKKLLQEKYANLNLNFEKQNDLNRFASQEQELKSIVKSLGTNITRPAKLLNEYSSISEIIDKSNTITHDNYSRKINNKILNNFEKHFTELEIFTNQMLEYTKDSSLFIKKMKEIPIYSG